MEYFAKDPDDPSVVMHSNEDKEISYHYTDCD